VSAITVVFDADSYSADAIQRAAYRFSDTFTLELTREGTNYRCELHFRTELDEAVVGAFRAEVLDHVLRERIRAETKDVRNLVLAVAFSNTTLNAE
jgi:His-Xaa-Ser system protein HxsD